ncbi:hypothetical protein [Desulfovibrio piger]|uniref:hypothetical protein n=1 Tax=Desulfovibrio piger TaxID=901 RepID=UPI00093167EE|nr:hypothetical protein [Desulfovibrio piger]
MMPQREALRKQHMKSAMFVARGSDTGWNMDMAQERKPFRHIFPGRIRAWFWQNMFLPARILKARDTRLRQKLLE